MAISDFKNFSESDLAILEKDYKTNKDSEQEDSKEIRQHNAITTAKYEMSACEMDIFFCTLALLRAEDKPGTLYRIYFKELEELTGRVWQHKQFKESTEKLINRVYEIAEENKLLQVSLYASAEYRKGYVELEISEKIRPYLIDIQKNFTSFRLKAALSLSSKYAKRIYQLTSQWKDVGQVVYDLDEFKYMLNLKDIKGKQPEQYAMISAFTKYVLDVSKEQINEHTDLKVDYELIKKGRKFSKLRFLIDRQKHSQLPIAFEETVNGSEKDKRERLEKALNSFGLVNAKVVKEICDYHTEAAWKLIYDLRTNDKQTASIKNIPGYIVSTLGLTKKPKS